MTRRNLVPLVSAVALIVLAVDLAWLAVTR